MTTYEPQQQPPLPPKGDQYSNKFIAAVVTTIVGVLVQWLATNTGFQLKQEGVTAIVGAVTALLVYLVSNWTRRGI